MHNKKSLSYYASIFLLCGYSTLIHANDTTRSHEFLLGLALTAGGDDLAKVKLIYDDGDTETDNIEAGGLIYFYGGVQFETPAFPLRLTVGYYTDSVDADNGSVSFTRIPLEAIGIYSNGLHSFGAGLSYHLSPELDLSDLGSRSIDADNALGVVLMYEYDFENNVSLGVRYTNISYDFEGEDVDGNNIGLFMGLNF